MRKIKMISPGKHKELWLIDALAEYEKRLSRDAKIEWLFPKELSSPEEPFVLLDVQGTPVTSEQFSTLILSKPRHTFVIGGPDGPPPALKVTASSRISLSALTFTHQFARLILLEQIYRAFEISKNSSYHK